MRLIDDIYYAGRRVNNAVGYRFWRPNKLESMYFMNDWEQWLYDLSFERCSRNKIGDTRYASAFVGWHCKEIFSIRLEERIH